MKNKHPELVVFHKSAEILEKKSHNLVLRLDAENSGNLMHYSSLRQDFWKRQSEHRCKEGAPKQTQGML